jgi:hypothetical protein
MPDGRERSGKVNSAPLIRMIDRIRASRQPIAQMGAAMLDAANWQACEAQLQRQLERVPLIIADNIDEFTLGHGWHETGRGIDPKDIPNLVPPFASYWYEWQWADPNMRKYGHSMAGALVESHECQDFHQEPVHRWEITILPFLLDSENRIFHPIFRPIAWTTEAGDLVYCTMDDSPFARHVTYAQDERAMRDLALAILTPCLIGLTFLNCRNVGLIDAPPAPLKLSKAHHKRTGKWLAKYRLIDITPMSRIVRAMEREGDTSAERKARSLHVVRGHFKRYQDGQGLFGRVKGTFFWHQQARGSMAAGESRTDYRIRTDGQKTQPK